jgi:hypothetical protein
LGTRVLTAEEGIHDLRHRPALDLEVFGLSRESSNIVNAFFKSLPAIFDDAS